MVIVAFYSADIELARKYERALLPSMPRDQQQAEKDRIEERDIERYRTSNTIEDTRATVPAEVYAYNREKFDAQIARELWDSVAEKYEAWRGPNDERTKEAREKAAAYAERWQHLAESRASDIAAERREDAALARTEHAQIMAAPANDDEVQQEAYVPAPGYVREASSAASIGAARQVPQRDTTSQEELRQARMARSMREPSQAKKDRMWAQALERMTPETRALYEAREAAEGQGAKPPQGGNRFTKALAHLDEQKAQEGQEQTRAKVR